MFRTFHSLNAWVTKLGDKPKFEAPRDIVKHLYVS